MSMPDLDLGLTETDLLVQSNPEAMLDVLTIRSFRTRYIDNDVTSVASEPLISLDRDLDTFVRDFQIDDSISDIFLMEDEPKKPKNKQSIFGSTSTGKNSKKSNRRSQSADNIIEATETGSTSSKKPKTFSSLFSRKSKPKTESRKAKAVTWHSQTNGVPASIPSKLRAVNSVVHKVEDAESGYMTMNKATRISVGSNPRSGIKETGYIPGNKGHSSPDIDGEYAILHTVCTDSTKFDELVALIEKGNTQELVNDLRTMPPDILCKLCDNRGNNILHKCVLKNKASLISTIVSIHPNLASHVNKEEMTPAELAVKLGRTACVKTFMEKVLPEDTGTCVAHLSELLTFAMHCRQDKTVAVILDHLEAFTSESSVPLPTSGRRGPVSHVAAERGDITCIQVMCELKGNAIFKRLVEMGFDVTSAKTAKRRPVNTAYQKGCQTTFRYLLVLHVLESVLKETISLNEKHKCASLGQQELMRERYTLGEKMTLLETANRQYQTLMRKHNTTTRQCADIVEHMLEDKENIKNADNLNQLKHLLTSMTDSVSASEDMTRHIKDMSNILKSKTLQVPQPTEVTTNEASTATRNLIKEAHKSWTSPEFSFDELVQNTLSAETKFQSFDTRKKPTTKPSTTAVHEDGHSSKGRSNPIGGDGRKHLPTPVDSTFHSQRDVRQSRQDISRHYRNDNLSSTGKEDKATLPNPEMYGDNNHKLHQNVSHEYDVIDKRSIERENSEAKGFPENESLGSCAIPGVRKISLVSKKSPDYATISSDIGDGLSRPSAGTCQFDSHSDFSDEDSMSTISSHNSTLQSAVGHLPHGCLSDSDDSLTDTSEVHGRHLNGNDHIIGQFDVSDFSGDNSSDWWSASKCTSCFSQMTHSQMTSYFSEDEYENECYNYVRLNLENEDLPDELLRNHRLCRHLEAVRRLSTENRDVIETVVTASGERIGSVPSDIDSRYINVSDSSDTGHSNQSVPVIPGKDKKKSRVKLFNHCELVSKRELSQSEFLECYDRSADVIHTNRCHDDLDLPWDQLQFSDIEEDSLKDKPWYDVSEDEESLTHAWSSDSEASTLCNSSQE